MSVLVLFAHPALERSRVNAALIAAAATTPGVRVHDLYEIYPDFDVDVRHEQALLLSHDTIVFQHPLFWYSLPALSKQWLDLVLQHGWAYGRGGDRLEGKAWVSAVSTGGPASAYTHEGFHGATLDELLLPLRQTVKLCRMRWLPPHVTHGAHALDRDGIAAAADAYQQRLAALVDGGR